MPTEIRQQKQYQTKDVQKDKEFEEITFDNF